MFLCNNGWTNVEVGHTEHKRGATHVAALSVCTQGTIVRVDLAPTAEEPSEVGKWSRGDGRSQARTHCGWWTVQWQFHAFSRSCRFSSCALARSPPVLASLSLAKLSLPVDTQAQEFYTPLPTIFFLPRYQEFDSPMAGRPPPTPFPRPLSRQHMINHNGCAFEITKCWKMHKIPT